MVTPTGFHGGTLSVQYSSEIESTSVYYLHNVYGGGWVELALFDLGNYSNVGGGFTVQYSNVT
jgi:hypothetical protein